MAQMNADDCTWEERHINENKPKLVKLTTWNIELESILIAGNVLGRGDVELIKSKPTPTEKSAQLYDIVVSRRHGYQKLTNALLEERQSGAYDILMDGVYKRGLPEMKIVLSNDPIELKEVLHDDEIQMVSKVLTESLGEDKFVDLVMNSQVQPFKLVKSGIPTIPPYYIPRSLSNRICIQKEFFRQNVEDVFVFKNMKMYQLTEIAEPYACEIVRSSTQLLNISSRFILLEEENHWDNIRDGSKTPIHLIKFDDTDDNFILECTVGHSTTMHEYSKAYSRDQKCYISEDEFVQKQSRVEDSSGVCICDTPGMGKSLLLANLAVHINEANPDRVGVFMTFTELLGSLHEPLPEIGNNGDDALDIIIGQVAPEKAENIILQAVLQRPGKKLNLFLDGFDELSPADVDWTKLFLRSLCKKTHKVKVYLTSRPHHRRELEKTLGVIAYDMLPFSNTNQVDFLELYWKNQIKLENIPSELTELATFCLLQMKKRLTIKEHDIMGIPLQCNLLAQLYTEVAKKICTYNAPIQISEKTIHDYSSSAFKMYKTFIDKCFDTYETKARSHKDLGNGCFPSKAAMENYHVWKALCLLFPDAAVMYAHENPVDQVTPDKRHLSVGLLEERVEGQTKKVQFIHRTIAEFLVAKHLVDLLSKDLTDQRSITMLKSIFSTYTNGKYNVQEHPYRPGSGGYCDGYTFQHPVMVYFINQWLKDHTRKNLNPNVLSTLVPSEYPGDRLYKLLYATIHHQYTNLICIPIKLLHNSNDKTLMSYKEYFSARIIGLRKNNNHFIHEMIEPSNVLLCAAVDLANICMVKDIYKLLVSYFKYSGIKRYPQGSFCTATPLQLAVKRPNYEMTVYLLDKFPTERENLIYWCIRHSYSEDFQDVVKTRISICEMLLSKYAKIIKEAVPVDGDVDDCGPMFVENVHLEILKILASNGATLQKSDIDFTANNSFLSSAACYMSQDDFDSLCKFCAQLHSNGLYIGPDWKFTLKCMICLYICKYGLKEETLELVLSLGSTYRSEIIEDIHLFAAVFSGAPVKTIQQLAEHGANYNYKNCDDVGILHCAVAGGNVETLEYLLSNGLSLKGKDCYGNTALHTVADRNYTQKLADQIKKEMGLSKTDNPSQSMRHSDYHCFPMLEHATKSNKDIWSFLIMKTEYSTIFSIKNKTNETPLHTVLKCERNRNQDEIINLLLNVPGTDVNNVDIDGNNLFLSSVRSSQDISVLNALILYGANFKFCNQKKQNALHICVNEECIDVNLLLYLLGIGVDANQKDILGLTPLDNVKTKSYWRKPIANFQSIIEDVVSHGSKGIRFVSRWAFSGSEGVKLFISLLRLGIATDSFQNLFDLMEQDRNGETFLHILPYYCSPQDYHDVVDFLIKQNLDEIIFVAREDGITAFHIAERYLELLPETLSLIRNKKPGLESISNTRQIPYFVDVGKLDNDGNSILHLNVMRKSSVKVLKRLISTLSDPVAEHNYNETSMNRVHYEGLHRNVLKQNKNGRTFLHAISPHYTAEDYHEIVEFLLQNKYGDIFHIADKDGLTPIMQAVRTMHKPILIKTIELITSGINPCRRLNVPSNNTINLHTATKEGLTILHIAAMRWQGFNFLKDLINLILKIHSCHQSAQRPRGLEDCLVMTQNRKGESFIHIFPHNCSPEEYHELAEFLVQNGLGDIFGVKDEKGWTPIHIAADAKKILPKTITLLVESYITKGRNDSITTKSSYLNAVTDDGQTILHIAVENRSSLNFLKHLMKSLRTDAIILPELSANRLGDCFDITKTNSEGKSFLHIFPNHVSPEDYHEMVEFLVRNGLSDIFGVKDKDGWTPIHRAVCVLELLPMTLDLFSKIYTSNGKLVTPKIKSVHLTAVTDNGETILHIAVQYKRSLYLLKHLIGFSFEEGILVQHHHRFNI